MPLASDEEGKGRLPGPPGAEAIQHGRRLSGSSRPGAFNWSAAKGQGKGPTGGPGDGPCGVSDGRGEWATPQDAEKAVTPSALEEAGARHSQEARRARAADGPAAELPSNRGRSWSQRDRLLGTPLMSESLQKGGRHLGGVQGPRCGGSPFSVCPAHLQGTPTGHAHPSRPSAAFHMHPLLLAGTPRVAVPSAHPSLLEGPLLK